MENNDAVKELYELCYNYEEKYNWVYLGRISRKYWPLDLMEKYHVSASQVFTCAYRQLESKMGKNIAKAYALNKRKITSNATFMSKNSVFEWLLDEPDVNIQDEIINYGKISGSFIHEYTLTLGNREAAEAADTKLKEIFQSHANRLKESKSKERSILKKAREEEKAIELKKQIDNAQILFNDLLVSGYDNIQNYANAKNIDIKILKDALSLIRKNCPADWEMILKKMDENFLKNYAYLYDLIEDIIVTVEADVVCCDGTTRAFDIVDYTKKYGYDLMTLKRFNNLVIPCPKSAIINRFIGKNYRPDENDEAKVKEVVYNVNYYYDNGKEITLDEKIYIYNKLISLNIPFNKTNYTVMIYHYLEDEKGIVRHR